MPYYDSYKQRMVVTIQQYPSYVKNFERIDKSSDTLEKDERAP